MQKDCDSDDCSSVEGAVGGYDPTNDIDDDFDDFDDDDEMFGEDVDLKETLVN